MPFWLIFKLSSNESFGKSSYELINNVALGNLENTDALNALQQALDDPDRDVSIYAERAIKKIQNLTS